MEGNVEKAMIFVVGAIIVGIFGVIYVYSYFDPVQSLRAEASLSAHFISSSMTALYTAEEGSAEKELDNEMSIEIYKKGGICRLPFGDDDCGNYVKVIFKEGDEEEHEEARILLPFIKTGRLDNVQGFRIVKDIRGLSLCGLGGDDCI